MDEIFIETLKPKEEPVDYEDASFTELKQEVLDLDESTASHVLKKEPEPTHFLEFDDVHDTSTASFKVEDIDPIYYLKEEPRSPFLSAQRSVRGDAFNGGSCSSELRTAPTPYQYFVHLERLVQGIPHDRHINVQQMFDTGLLQSQKSDAVLSQTDCSNAGSLQDVSSKQRYTQGRDSLQVHRKQIDGDFLSVTREVSAFGRDYCEQCLKTVRPNAANTLPVNGHERDTRKCIRCQKCFTNKYLPERHFENVRTHTEKPYQCSQCPKSLMTKSALKVHMRVHSGERPYQCSECDKAFTQNAHLKSHMLLHSGEHCYQCSQCDKSFAQKIQLKLHMSSHTGDRPYQCSQCDKAFTTERILKTHITLHTGERPYQCSRCDKSFTQKGHLKSHMTLHTGERPHRCSQCDRAFAQKIQLEMHMRLHAGYRPHECSQCDKAFTTQRNLKAHMKLHTGGRPHHCSCCGQGFTKNCHLKTHMKLHTGERPYQCSQCNKAFTEKHILNKHMISHSEERPYHCTQCNKAFKQSSHLKTHMKYHTTALPY